MTDADLVRRAAAGGTRPFEMLVDRHYDRCLRFAWRQLGTRADAEEAVQDAFVRAHRALATCAPERFRPWLMSILVNRCRNYAARARRLAQRFAPLDETGIEASAAAPEQRTDDFDGSAVARAVAALSPALREVFLLRHVEELTYEEIAAMTGVGVSALKMRVRRAGEALSRALENGHG